MKWLEMIQLRVVDGKRRPLESEINKLIEEVGSKGKKQMVIVYNHSLIDTDYCVQVVHDSAAVENPGSPLGLRLADALKEFGMVNHSVWGEVKRT